MIGDSEHSNNLNFKVGMNWAIFVPSHFLILNSEYSMNFDTTRMTNFVNKFKTSTRSTSWASKWQVLFQPESRLIGTRRLLVMDMSPFPPKSKRRCQGKKSMSQHHRFLWSIVPWFSSEHINIETRSVCSCQHPSRHRFPLHEAAPTEPMALQKQTITLRDASRPSHQSAEHCPFCPSFFYGSFDCQWIRAVQRHLIVPHAQAR